MHKLYELKEKLMEEMEAYSENGKYSKEDVESIKYLSSAVDHICNIIERCEDEEYSMAGGSYGDMSYDDMSYARGNRGGSRGGRVNYSRARRRDSMGRYSRAEDFRMELQDLIKDAPNDHVRQKMQAIMSEM